MMVEFKAGLQGVEVSEFKSFGKIERYNGLGMSITQKLHGTNAQILIEKQESGEWLFKTASRTRWIEPGDDNYGFAAWAYSNKDALIESLGEGRHFGEWVGAGINSGEGLKEKTFALFDWKRHQNAYREGKLPANVCHVPVLMYSGRFSDDTIASVMQDLKENGSKLVPGFMRPEGVVINIDGTLYKRVFDAEETQWTKSGTVKRAFTEVVDVNYLLQPIRMEKVISRDERNIIDFPKTLPDICRAYVQDLQHENQLIYSNEDEKKGLIKEVGKQVFRLAKDVFSDKFTNTLV